MARIAAIAILAWSLGAADPVDVANGWRGNGTGIWPDASPPLTWSRIPAGVLESLKTRADKPGDRPPGTDDAPPAKGLIRDWLLIGPFPVADSSKDFAKEQIAGEEKLQPAEGDKAGDLAWKKFAAPVEDPFAFGPADLPWTDLVRGLGGCKRNQVAYAHTYLHSEKGGTVRALVEHAHGMKVWLNGKEVYSRPSRSDGGMGNYYALSRVELSIYPLNPASRFEMELRPGWNRLLLKLSTYPGEGSPEMRFVLRLMDLPSVPYEEKNILWATELPHRSNATPIIVGDKLFVMAEPDELICIDKRSGRILWSAATNYYETLTPDERQSNPDYAAKVDPLIVQLKKEPEFIKRQLLRTQIHKTLTEIDFNRFAWKADGHFEAHFGIVGFTTPTPVSDGKHVWVWCGDGTAACYDLDGKRQWITRVPAKELSYASSPALANGTLAVFLHKLYGLDAKTGQIRWTQPKININNGAVLAAKIAGVHVFVSQRGHVVRASDGQVLHREENPSGDIGWAPPVVLGDVVYSPKHGVIHLNVLDFSGASGDEWKPKRDTIEISPCPLANGSRVDRWTAGSPLVVGDTAYVLDIYGSFCAIDLKTKKMLYSQDSGLRGLFHYNSLPVAASATLVGKHIVIQNNQGSALVLQPGPNYQEVGKNRIATQIDRYWPLPGQESLGYSPPVADGKRLYLRGERYLYCIGEK
jgi:outer membrane protein assembly factor BamB